LQEEDTVQKKLKKLHKNLLPYQRLAEALGYYIVWNKGIAYRAKPKLIVKVVKKEFFEEEQATFDNKLKALIAKEAVIPDLVLS
jgi:hypothetical protein